MAITPEVLVELIDSTVVAREETEARLRDIRQELEELENERAALEQEEEGYRAALARRFPEIAAESAPEEAPRADVGLFPLADDFTTQPRSDAVETAVRILTQEAPSASPADIESFLRDRGRSDSRDAVGAALAYLNRTSRVTNVGRGQWRLAERS